MEMENGDVHMAPASNEIRENLKKKMIGSIVLDSFTKLSSDRDQIRIKAGLSLLCHFIKTNSETEHEYMLDRIIRGVGSSRSSSKTGYYSVLVGLLTKRFAISISNVLQAVKKHLSTGGSNSKSENADICMGQILVCGALIHSDRYQDASVEEQKSILEILIAAGKKRSYLSLASYTFLTELIEKLNEEQFKLVWLAIKEEISKPWKDQTLDTIYFLSIGRTKFPSVVKSKFLKRVLEVPEIVHEDSMNALCNILLNIPSVASLKHPVFKNISNEIVAKSLIKEWCLEMDNCLQKSNRNRQLVMTTFLVQILENMTDYSVIPDILTNSYIKYTMHTLKQCRPRENNDHEFILKMNLFFKTLTEKLQNDGVSDKTKLAIIKKLLFYPGTFIFEKITRTKIIQQITMSLTEDGVKTLAKLYKEVVVAKKLKVINENDSENWINADRVYAAQLFVKLLTHSAVQKEIDWKLDQLKFLLRISLFKDGEKSVIGVELAAALKDCFYHSLDQRFSKLEDLRNILSSLIHYINENVFINSIHQMRITLTEDCMNCWSEMMQLISKLEEEHKFKHSNAIPVFHTLLLHMGLQLFQNFELAQSTLKELYNCLTRLETQTPKKKKLIEEQQLNANEPIWIEVVVDLFLSLLSQNSHLLRNIINCVFPYLCPHLTITAIRQILDVLDPKNEQNPLSKYGDESDSSDDDDDVDDVNADKESDIDDEEEIVNESDDAEESDDSGLEEENMDYEEETKTDKLRMAVRDALHKTGYQTDDESEDMDKMDEDEGEKLDEALAVAFKLIKRPKRNKNKQTKNDKTLTHFRVRVLDLIDIYIDSEPSMIQCLEIVCLLLQTLEFSIRDVHQKPLEHRIRSCLKKVCAKKKINSTDGVTEAVLTNMLNSILEKGSKSPFIYQDMGDMIADSCTFIVRCSQMLANENVSPKKSKKSKSQIAETFKGALVSFFTKRDCLFPLALFKNVLQLSWEGNWCLVPLLVNYAFKTDIRPFRRSQALELLTIFYCNSRFRILNLDEFKTHIAPLETELSNKTLELLQSLSINAKGSILKEKFVNLLLTLLSHVKNANCSENVDWKIIAESVKEYRSHVSLSKDAKQAYNKFCRELGISNLVKMQLTETLNGHNANDSDSDNNSQEAREEKKRKKAKSLTKDAHKLKKEARLLRLKASSEGLTNNIDFSNVDLSNIQNDDFDENDSENDEPKMKKKKNKVIQENGNSGDEIPIKKSKSKKHKIQQNGDEPTKKSKKLKKKYDANDEQIVLPSVKQTKKRHNSESDDKKTKKKIKHI